MVDDDDRGDGDGGIQCANGTVWENTYRLWLETACTA